MSWFSPSTRYWKISPSPVVMGPNWGSIPLGSRSRACWRRSKTCCRAEEQSAPAPALEHHRDRREADLGEGADLLKAGKPSHRGLDGEGDLLLHFGGSHPARLGENLHLDVRDVGERVHGEPAHGPQAGADQEKGRDNDQQPLFQRESQDPVDHWPIPLRVRLFSVPISGGTRPWPHTALLLSGPR